MSIEIKNLLEASNQEIKSALEVSQTEIASLKSRLDAAETALARPAAIKTKGTDEFAEFKGAFVNFLRNPTSEQSKSVLRELSAKSMNTATGAAGGYAVPSAILAGISNKPVNVGAIRKHAEVINADTPNVSKLVEANTFGYEWVSETGTRNTTATPVYDSRVVAWGTIAGKAPVTLNMLEDASFDVFNEVVSGLNRQFILAESIAFISGTGNNQPSGILSGNTVQTVVSGNASAIGSPDVLLDLTLAVDPSYHANAVYVMNSKTKAAIAKMKNSEGDYLVRESVIHGVPATLWGYPIEIDNNMPDIASNATPILFGNLYEGYLVADRGAVSVMEDPYTSLGFINFIGRKRVGGVVKDARALAKLKIAAA